MRTQRVVVAIVPRGLNEFLVTYNPKWDGYAFPMRAIDGDEPIFAADAIAAVRNDLDMKLPKATAEDLESFGRAGVSGRTGEETYYHYAIFAVDPGEPLPIPPAVPQSRPPLFVPYNVLAGGGGITWSSASIVQEFVENQEVALAVVTRPGERETEFLLIENRSYGGLFFPCQRVKSEIKPERWAESTVRHELGFHGEVKAVRLAEVPDVHFSQRYFHDRRYRFHVCHVQLPDIDIHLPFNRFERGMIERGKRFVWIKAGDLAAELQRQARRPREDGGGQPDDQQPGAAKPRPPKYSPTMSAVWTTVAQVMPPQIIPQPLRTSEGGIALIERKIGQQTQWLAQFNEGWHAYFLIGGHREPPESFRDCVVREIKEELGLDAADCAVSPTAANCLQYNAHSRRAGELTAYTMELYAAQPSPAALTKIEADGMNRFLTASEILRLGADDGRDVSETVLSLLAQAGRITL